MAQIPVRNKGEVPVFSAVDYQKHKRTIIVDGKKRTEKRPIQKSVRMVDPAGNVCWVPLYCGPAQTAEVDPYRVSIEHAKRKKGWILLDKCPQRGGQEVGDHLPESVLGRKACSVGAKGGEISVTDPCQCVLDVIKERQSEHRVKMEELEYVLNAQAMKAAETQAEILKETREQNVRIAQALQAVAGKASKADAK